MIGYWAVCTFDKSKQLLYRRCELSICLIQGVNSLSPWNDCEQYILTWYLSDDRQLLWQGLGNTVISFIRIRSRSATWCCKYTPYHLSALTCHMGSFKEGATNGKAFRSLALLTEKLFLCRLVLQWGMKYCSWCFLVCWWMLVGGRERWSMMLTDCIKVHGPK